VKELGPGDSVVDEKAMTVDEQGQDDSSLAQQNSALAMLRTGNVCVPTCLSVCVCLSLTITLSVCVCDSVSVSVSLSLYHCYRQDAVKWQTASIKFTHRPKIRFFCPAGATRCTDSCQTWQC